MTLPLPRILVAALFLLLGAFTAGPLLAAPKVWVLGDSFAAGYGLPQAQGFVPRLSAWLKDRGAPATLINASIPGDTTYGGRIRARWHIPADADAVIVALGANDMLTALPPSGTERNLRAIIRAAGDRPVLVIGVSAQGYRAPAYVQRFDAIWPRLAASGVPVVADFAAPVRRLTKAARRPYFQRDKLHPSALGVAAIVDHVGPQVAEFVRGLPQ